MSSAALTAIWRRPLWMRLGALSGVGAILVMLIGPPSLHAVAQIQFVHAMATFACATFMNIGAVRARWAPALFLGGALLWCGPAYVLAAGGPSAVMLIQPAGFLALICGWGVLAWSAGGVDRA